jgi:uncharacterized protein YceK
MKKLLLCLCAGLVMTGCTQIVTAPIKVAGAVVGTAVDIVTPDD